MIDYDEKFPLVILSSYNAQSAVMNRLMMNRPMMNQTSVMNRPVMKRPRIPCRMSIEAV